MKGSRSGAGNVPVWPRREAGRGCTHVARGLSVRRGQLAMAAQRGVFFCGRFGWEGWTLFFPCSLALKTPLSAMLVFVLAAPAAVVFSRQGTRGDSWRMAAGAMWYAVAPLLISARFLRSKCAWLAYQYRPSARVLPLYPPAFILGGAAAWWFVAPRSTAAGQSMADSVRRTPPQRACVSGSAALVVAALVTNVSAAIVAWPDYLAYFNMLGGGPSQGYRWFVDSSLDWGQDLKELKGWADRHPDDGRDAGQVFLSYFGTTPPDYYGIEAELMTGKGRAWRPQLAAQPLAGGTYCITPPCCNRSIVGREAGWRPSTTVVSRGAAVHGSLRNGRSCDRRWILGPPIPGGPEVWPAFRLFEELRLARLCCYLAAPSRMTRWALDPDFIGAER